jgi:hypothetical protein
MEDLEAAVIECMPEDSPKKLTNFDTSCFTGTYVTGEQLGDEYFTRLHELRNDSAQHGGGVTYNKDTQEPVLKPPPAQGRKQSNGGCEAMVNDTSVNKQSEGRGCEPIVNKDGAA